MNLFNAYIESGQALLSAIPKRAEAALPVSAKLHPHPPVVSVAVRAGRVVGWTCRIGFEGNYDSIRVGYVDGSLHIAHDSAESLAILRAVMNAGHLYSFAFNHRIHRWVAADYTKG
jgi:hypothetical protein